MGKKELELVLRTGMMRVKHMEILQKQLKESMAEGLIVINQIEGKNNPSSRYFGDLDENRDS